MSRKGHVPVRMCVGCRERKTKDKLFRFTRSPEGHVFLCEQKPFAGKGFYLCPELKCFLRAKKKIRMSEVVSVKDGSPISLEARFSK